MQASKVLLQYLAGKPVAVVNPDRVHHDEWELRREQPTQAEVEEQQDTRVPHRLALKISRAWDVGKQIQFRDQFREALAKDEARRQRKEKRRAARRNGGG